MDYELTPKILREQREFETLFRNPKHARKSWAQNILNRLTRPAIEPIYIADKDGNPSPTYVIEKAIWDHLCQELKDAGLDRPPSEGEMMDACQQYYSRHNAASYTARRDSAGAKPIDETKQNIAVDNPLEGLSDEELFVMQQALGEYREKLEQIRVKEITDGSTD